MTCYFVVDPKWLSWLYVQLVERGLIEKPISSTPPPLEKTLPVKLIDWPVVKEE